MKRALATVCCLSATVFGSRVRSLPSAPPLARPVRLHSGLAPSGPRESSARVSRAPIAPGIISTHDSSLAPFVGTHIAAGLAAANGLPLAAPTRSGQRTSTARSALESTEALESLRAAVEHAPEHASSLLVAFADQGQNINGILFQASLPPYLAFLYFLSYRNNNVPPLVKFGFAFLLTFVVSTIPSGIISKTTYGAILADCDWLHGAAESLLTCTNICLVLGFRGGLRGDSNLATGGFPQLLAKVWLAMAVLAIAAGIPFFNASVHTPFLGGLGAVDSLLSVAEPVNALSVPTWIVHWSTVLEWLIAISLAWQYAEVTGNPRWKGLAWAMLPSHMSSAAALTFHIFYNQVPWILTAQAGFTCLGNVTLALAAFRIAASNGWTVAELDPRPLLGKAQRLISQEGDGGEQKAEEQPDFDPSRLAAPLSPSELVPAPLLVVEVIAFSVACAYLTKYSGPLISVFQTTGAEATAVALLLIAVPASLLAYAMFGSSVDLKKGALPELVPSAGQSR